MSRPNGDGSLTVKTQSGDISVHPAGSGGLRMISDTEIDRGGGADWPGLAVECGCGPGGVDIPEFEWRRGRDILGEAIGNGIGQLGGGGLSTDAGRGTNSNIRSFHDNDCAIAAGSLRRGRAICCRFRRRGCLFGHRVAADGWFAAGDHCAYGRSAGAAECGGGGAGGRGGWQRAWRWQRGMLAATGATMPHFRCRPRWRCRMTW